MIPKSVGTKVNIESLVKTDNNGIDDKSEFLIAISHAGQDSELIASCVDMICSDFSFAEIFYDKFNYFEIEGRAEPRIYFRDIFLNRAKFIIVFMSVNYNENFYTKMEFEYIWKRYCQHPGRQDIIWITCDGIMPEELNKTNALPIDMRTRSNKEIIKTIHARVKLLQYQNGMVEHNNISITAEKMMVTSNQCTHQLLKDKTGDIVIDEKAITEKDRIVIGDIIEAGGKKVIINGNINTLSF